MVVATNVDDCPVCGAGDPRTVFKPDESAWQRFDELSRRKYQGQLDGWRGELDLVVLGCRSCNHLWHHSQPDETSLMRMYGSAVRLSAKPADPRPSAHMIQVMAALYRLTLRRGAVKPRLLDYGSGGGRWSRAAAEVGFAVTAFEPSVERQAQDDPQRMRQVSDLQSLAGEVFDAINLEQVLEHTRSPLQILTGLPAHAHARTVVRVTVPNVHRSRTLWTDFPFDGKSPHILSPYEHLHGFNSESLYRLLRRAGLRRIGSYELLTTHPRVVARQFAAILVPAVAQTLALCECEAH